MSDVLDQTVHALAQAARTAAQQLARTSTAQKNEALRAIAAALRARQSQIFAANELDLAHAREAGLAAAMLDRLALTPKAFAAMVDGLNEVVQLPDPVGEIRDLKPRPSGILVGKMRVPIGVIAIIYESRPNVTIDAAALTLKAGNAVILRGGKEALRTNQALAAAIADGLQQAGLPPQAVQIVTNPDRALVRKLIANPQHVDLVIPRGGKSLIEAVLAEARVPILKHLDGNCHVYIHRAANPNYILPIVENAKTQRYGVCNAAETLLIDAEIAPQYLPAIGLMFARHGVEMRCCPQALATLNATEGIPSHLLKPATEEDWRTEYLAPIIAIRVVTGIDQAIEHIECYSSRHTEAIITDDHAAAMRFLREVDSSSVMLNTSTRFADGYQYGLGAEIGISTDKFHARGPVGLEGLTCEKWIVLGSGQTRQ
ncbi:MAG: glutamate-5-semialdehyde dehydrogenase [Hydrogenophilus sp.]|nr:glutamate-5-semialdehyde dehydrogenase [Hydrogenophilus sp.]